MPRGEIWTINLPQPKGKPGHEQQGRRPGIVVQADIADPKLPTTIVIPTTSNQDPLRFPYTMLIPPSAHNGLDKSSVLLVFQIRAIDKDRLVRRLGWLEHEHLHNMEKNIRALLDI
jgi:mRNA interferase MazF